MPKKNDLNAVLSRLWQVPIYLPYLQPKLTPARVARAEKKLGVRLPRAYLAALEVQNGGYVRPTEHPCGHAEVDVIAGIGPYFPSILETDWTEIKEFMAEAGFKRPRKIDLLIPFCGDGHYHFCFDYRKRGRRAEPQITYVDVESFDIDEVLAPDFETFLGQLSAPVERGYGFVTRDKPADVARAFRKATGIRLQDQGDQLYGYPFFNAQIDGESWVHLSANHVRKGFAPKDDERYSEIKKLLPEVVARFPDHEDCGYVLTCDAFNSPAGRNMVKALRNLPFEVRAIQGMET